MEVYLRITQLYLEEQDHVSAEAYLNRAGLLQTEVNNIELQILYKVLTVPEDSYQYHKTRANTIRLILIP